MLKNYAIAILSLLAGCCAFSAAADVHHFDTPANTYIVTGEGDYSFDATTPSGAAIAGAESAGWIWATKQVPDDTEQALISDVRLEDGKVYFHATANKGNAVVAVFDSSRTSLRVWLIWLTDQPEVMEFETGSKFMDRGIGAISAEPGDLYSNPTILYQFGRCVPLYGGFDDELESGTFYEANMRTVLNPEYGYKWEVSSTAGDIAYSFAHPTTFFIMATGNPSWLTNEMEALGKWQDVDSDHNPCPAGFIIPDPEDWGDIVKDYKIKFDAGNNGGIYTYNGKSAWFPIGNMGRDFSDGSYIENSNMTQSLTYWNRSMYVDDLFPGIMPANYFACRCGIYFDRGVLGNNSQSMANPTFAFAIRPVQKSSSTAIRGIGSDQQQADVTLSGDILDIQGAAPGQEITVWGIDGKRVASVRADQSGNASSSLSSLRGGVYVVKAGAKAVKVTR